MQTTEMQVLILAPAVLEEMLCAGGERCLPLVYSYGACPNCEGPMKIIVGMYRAKRICIDCWYEEEC